MGPSRGHNTLKVYNKAYIHIISISKITQISKLTKEQYHYDLLRLAVEISISNLVQMYLLDKFYIHFTWYFEIPMFSYLYNNAAWSIVSNDKPMFIIKGIVINHAFFFFYIFNTSILDKNKWSHKIQFLFIKSFQVAYTL